MITLNNFLNSHLEAIHLGIIPQHISIFANEFPEFYDDSTVWPFHFSEDDSTPSLEQLSEITYLYLDPRAWSLDKFYLEYLPNLRELYLQHPGSPDLDFLRKIPQLQVLQLNCEQLPDQTPLLALKDLRHLLLDDGGSAGAEMLLLLFGEVFEEVAFKQGIDEDAELAFLFNGKIAEGQAKAVPRVETDAKLGVDKIHKTVGMLLQEGQNVVKIGGIEVDVFQLRKCR